MRIRILLTLLVFATLLGVGAPTALAAPQAVCLSMQELWWYDSTRWTCGRVPTADDVVVINDKHLVVINMDAVAYQIIVGGTESGTLVSEFAQRTLTVGRGGLILNKRSTFESTSTLNIAGDLTNNGGIFRHRDGTVVMNGTSPQNISGAFTFRNLTISNTVGVNLTSNATVTGTLTLNTDLTVHSGYALTMGVVSITSGNADVVGKVRRAAPFNAGTAYAFGSPYTTITFAPGGTLPSEIAVELFKTAPGGLANAVQRYYSITPIGGSDYTFTLRLHYRDAELGGINENDLQMWQQVNGRWTLRAVTNRDTTNNWVETTGLTSFSLWALSNSGAPTAVNLSSFDARADAPNALPFVGLGALAVLALGVWWNRR